MVGGLLADAVTDVLQGLVVIAGLLALGIAVASQVPGPWLGLAAIDAGRLSLFAADDGGWIGHVEKLAVPICGTIVAVEVISRFLGARSPREAALGTMLGAGLYLLLGLIPIYLGLVGPGLLTDLKATEEIVPRLAQAFLPTTIYVLFIGAIISAILSVVHATLHAPAAQLSHNVLLRIRPQAKASGRLWAVRLTVAGLSVIATLLASTAESIKDLVETASALGSAGVFVAAMFGLFTKIGGAPSAYASIVAGTIMWAWSKYVFGMTTPYLIALAAACGSYLAVAAIERYETSRE